MNASNCSECGSELVEECLCERCLNEFRKEGAIDELKDELEYFENKTNMADDYLRSNATIPIIHSTAFQVWSNYNSEVERLKKRILLLEGEIGK